MKAVLTVVIAAIEAMAVALAAFVVITVPTVLVWWLAFDLAADPLELLPIVVSLWQLTHLLPIDVTIDPQTMLSLGLGADALEFTLSLAPLGLTLLTAALAFRSGWRFTGRGALGSWSVLGGAIGFGMAAAFLALIVGESESQPLWLAIAVPTLLYAVAAAAGAVLRSARDDLDWWAHSVRAAQRLEQRIAPVAAAAFAARAAEVIRLAAVGVLGLLGLAGLGLAIAMVFSYVDIVTLSQGLQLDPLGVVVLFVIELSLLPVFWVWAAAWLAGPGFAIGIATSASPFETLLGPLPALPLFGAIPQSWGWAGALAPALVVALGAVVGALAAARPELRRSSGPVVLVVTLKAALLVGLAFAGLSALASGSIGPGRLAEVGPSPWVVGAFVALELGFGMSLGAFARRLDVTRLNGSASVGATTIDTDRWPATAGVATAAHREVTPTSPIAGADPNAETVPIEPLPPTESTAPPLGVPTQAEQPVDPDAETRPIEPLAPRSGELTVDPLVESADVSTDTVARSSGDDGVGAPNANSPAANSPTAAGDPLLDAFAWSAGEPSAEGQPAARRSWRDRLRSKRDSPPAGE